MIIFTKEQIQQRVLQNGKPLDLHKFTWDKKTKTFSSNENNLVLDFRDIDNCTFDTGTRCTFKTGPYCTFKTGTNCTFETGPYCTFNASSSCTFDTGANCTFKTDSSCTFDTGWRCTFDTDYDCTFKTGYGCTFDTDYDCTFKTGSSCVIINRNVFEVIQPNVGDIIQICPYDIEGHLVNGLYNGEPHIIADGILSKVISKKGGVYKVINHDEEEQSWIVEQDGIYSHGATLKQARDDLMYKLVDQDTSAYDNITIDTVLSKEECIKAYRTITGSCSQGVKYFVESQDNVKSEYKIKEILEVTKDQYGNERFKEFFTNLKIKI